MLRAVDLEQLRDQTHGNVIVDHAGSGLFPDARQNGFDDITDATSTREYANQFAFIVGDCQFAKCSATATNDDDEVAAANIDDFAAHQTAPREDQHIMGKRGRFVLEAVLVQTESW